MWLFALSLANASGLSGVVKEAGTGLTLSKIQVIYQGKTILSNQDGKFYVEVPDLTKSIVFQSPHHQTLIVLASKAPSVIWLKPRQKPYEVVVDSKQEMDQPFVQQLDREKVLQTPGTHQDALRLLQSLPSLVLTREYAPAAGDISLRAASPTESRIFIEGVEVPYLYHFQQYASVVHTRLLDKVMVYPSAYGSGYGDATGGIVSVELHEADRKQPHMASNLNLILAGLYGSVPVAGGAVSFSGRRSYADLLESSNDQYTQWPVFSDYLLRYDSPNNGDWLYSFTALGASDRYGRLLVDTSQLSPLEQENNPNFLFDRSYHALISKAEKSHERYLFRNVFGLVHDRWGGVLPEASQQRDETYLWWRQENILLLTEAFSLSLGGDAKIGSLHRLCACEKPWLTAYGEAPMLEQGQAVDEQMFYGRFGAWIEPRLSVNSVIMKPGLRLHLNPKHGDYALDPRFLLQWQRPQGSLRFGGGIYHQSPQEDVRSVQSGQSDLPMASAYQAAMGGDRILFKGLDVGLELWARSVRDQVRLRAVDGPQKVDGWAVGYELLTRYRLRQRFFVAASFAMNMARENAQVSFYDQPYAVQLVLSWKPSLFWSLGFRYRYAAGLPYISPHSSVYDAASDTYVPMLANYPNERLPDYQKIDVHIGKRWLIRDWQLSTYGEFWYIPPAANILYPIYNFDYTQSQLVVGPGFVPLVGVRVEK